MNKIVRILPGIFLSLLSLSSCDGLFRTEKEISDNYTRILKDIERVLGMEEIDVNSLFTDR